jgi:hypothetical protein
MGLHPPIVQTPSGSPSTFQSIHGFGHESVAVRSSMDRGQIADQSMARQTEQLSSAISDTSMMHHHPKSSLSAALLHSGPSRMSGELAHAMHQVSHKLSGCY